MHAAVNISLSLPLSPERFSPGGVRNEAAEYYCVVLSDEHILCSEQISPLSWRSCLQLHVYRYGVGAVPAKLVYASLAGYQHHECAHTRSPASPLRESSQGDGMSGETESI